MTFNDIFFMIVVPVAAVLATGLLFYFYWKSRLSALANSYAKKLQDLENQIEMERNSSDKEDSISRSRARLLFHWQEDMLQLLDVLKDSFGEAQVLSVDHEYKKPGNDQESQLENLIERISVLEKAKVRVKPELYFTAGYYQQLFKQLSKAESLYRQATEEDKTYTNARFNLARLLQRSKKWNEAVVVYKELVELRTNDAEVHFGLGVCLARTGQVDEGIDALITAIRHNPENPSAYTELAYAHSRNGDSTRAMEALQVALKLKPRFYQARLLQQELLIREGEFDIAIRECEKFLNQKQDGAVYYNLSKAHILSGDIETGLKVLRNALQIEDSLRFKAKDDSSFDSIRENKRFKELLEGRLGLF